MYGLYKTIESLNLMVQKKIGTKVPQMLHNKTFFSVFRLNPALYNDFFDKTITPNIVYDYAYLLDRLHEYEPVP